MSATSLRILMTADTVGGVWTYACELIEALAPFGVEVTLATMGGPLTPAQVRTAAALQNLEVVEGAFALEWMPDPWRDVDAAGDWLLGLAADTKPDIIHLNGYSHAALAFEPPVLTVAHSCVCTWFRAVRGIDAGPEWDEYRRRISLGLRRADAVVAPTAAILRAILDAHAPTIRGRVIANGRGAAAWPRNEKLPFVLGAGRLWDEAKGFRDLELCAAAATWPIYLAGPTMLAGVIADPAPSRARQIGDLPPDVLAGWMSRASIYALPARYEPFGLSILEAALAGCALVVGDIPTLREVWGDTAVYVRPGDPDSLAFELNALARDPVRRGTLAACARVRALTFTPRRMALAYRGLYHELRAVSARRQEVCA